MRRANALKITQSILFARRHQFDGQKTPLDARTRWLRRHNLSESSTPRHLQLLSQIEALTEPSTTVKAHTTQQRAVEEAKKILQGKADVSPTVCTILVRTGLWEKAVQLFTNSASSSTTKRLMLSTFVNEPDPLPLHYLLNALQKKRLLLDLAHDQKALLLQRVLFLRCPSPFWSNALSVLTLHDLVPNSDRMSPMTSFVSPLLKSVFQILRIIGNWQLALVTLLWISSPLATPRLSPKGSSRLIPFVVAAGRTSKPCMAHAARVIRTMKIDENVKKPLLLHCESVWTQSCWDQPRWKTSLENMCSLHVFDEIDICEHMATIIPDEQFTTQTLLSAGRWQHALSSLEVGNTCVAEKFPAYVSALCQAPAAWDSVLQLLSRSRPDEPEALRMFEYLLRINGSWVQALQFAWPHSHPKDQKTFFGFLVQCLLRTQNHVGAFYAVVAALRRATAPKHTIPTFEEVLTFSQVGAERSETDSASMAAHFLHFSPFFSPSKLTTSTILMRWLRHGTRWKDALAAIFFPTTKFPIAPHGHVTIKGLERLLDLRKGLGNTFYSVVVFHVKTVSVRRATTRAGRRLPERLAFAVTAFPESDIVPKKALTLRKLTCSVEAPSQWRNAIGLIQKDPTSFLAHSHQFSGCNAEIIKGILLGISRTLDSVSALLRATSFAGNWEGACAVLDAANVLRITPPLETTVAAFDALHMIFLNEDTIVPLQAFVQHLKKFFGIEATLRAVARKLAESHQNFDSQEAKINSALCTIELLYSVGLAELPQFLIQEILFTSELGDQNASREGIDRLFRILFELQRIRLGASTANSEIRGAVRMNITLIGKLAEICQELNVEYGVNVLVSLSQNQDPLFLSTVDDGELFPKHSAPEDKLTKLLNVLVEPAAISVHWQLALTFVQKHSFTFPHRHAFSRPFQKAVYRLLVGMTWRADCLTLLRAARAFCGAFHGVSMSFKCPMTTHSIAQPLFEEAFTNSLSKTILANSTVGLSTALILKLLLESSNWKSAIELLKVSQPVFNCNIRNRRRQELLMRAVISCRDTPSNEMKMGFQLPLLTTRKQRRQLRLKRQKGQLKFQRLVGSWCRADQFSIAVLSAATQRNQNLPKAIVTAFYRISDL